MRILTPIAATSFTRYFFLLLTALAFVGCKTEETVSLREAKTITAEYVGKTFKAPPRSVKNLLELASTHDRPIGVTKRKADLRSKAVAEPSEAVKNDPALYVDFLRKRANAWRRLREIPKALENARLAYRIFTRTKPSIKTSRFLRDISKHMYSGGDLSAAVRIAEEGLAHADSKNRYKHLINLIRFNVWRGEIEKAKQYLSELEFYNAGRSRQWRVYSGRAIIARAEGRWADAEQEARSFKAEKFFYSPTSRLLNRIADILARSLMGQGRFQEAELELRERVQPELKRYGSSRTPTMSELFIDLARVYIRAGRPEDALALARQSCATSKRLQIGWASTFGGLYECTLMQASSLLVLRRFQQARAAHDEIKAEYAPINPLNFDSSIRNSPNRLLTLILTGLEADTGTLIDGLLARLTEKLGPKHYRSAEAKALKAALLARSGEPAAALPLFREAFTVMARRSQSAGEGDVSLVRQRLVYLSEIYLDAIADVLAGKQTPALVEEAFRVSAEARAQRVSAAVSASASRSRIADPELAELARREQDAQRQVRALRALLANAALRGGSDAAREQLRARVDGLRAARAAIVKELEQRYPEYADIINPKPPGRSSIQHALRQDEALVSFYFTERRGLTFVAPKSGPITLVDSAVSRREITKRIAPLRAALDPDAATVEDIPAFDVKAAWTLYRDLLHPARRTLKDASHLLVVNHAAMGQLPLTVLTTEPVKPARSDLLFAEYRGAPWLARRWSSAVVASETAFVAGRSVPPPPSGRRELVAFGDPVFRVAQTETVQLASAAPVQSRGLRLRRRSVPRTLRLRSASLSDLSPLPDTREEGGSDRRGA